MGSWESGAGIGNGYGHPKVSAPCLQRRFVLGALSPSSILSLLKGESRDNNERPTRAQHRFPISRRRSERDIETKLALVGRNAVDQIDDAHGIRFVAPWPAEMGKRDLEFRLRTQGLEFDRTTITARPPVDEDAAVKKNRHAALGGDFEHRLRTVVARDPSGRHHLESTQAERIERAAGLFDGAGQARIDDGEADQSIAVIAHEIGRVRIGSRQRVSVVHRIAVRKERREQHAHVDTRFVERVQHVTRAFAAGAVQMRVDDHVVYRSASTDLTRFLSPRASR